MIVKVCGLTRREDALVAVEAGATALGFVFFKSSPRYVTPEQAAELGDGIAIQKVGIFVDQSAAAVEAVMRVAGLDVAQIYGGAAPAGARVWKAFRMVQGAKLPEAEDAEALLLDGASSGTGFDWTLARGASDLVRSGHVIVAGGLDASNVAAAIRLSEAWGVDASSRLESSPGVKDHNKVRKFVAAARQEFSC